jgi:hypothetical protein
MPAGFPAAQFDAIYEIVQSLDPNHSELRSHFVEAWLALGYRYRAMSEYGREFTNLIATDGPSVVGEKRYLQERVLFGFFGSAFAAFEASFFGLFAIGAILVPTDFPLATPADQRSVNADSTLRAYKRIFPADRLVMALEGITNDFAFRDLREIRNVLTHRAAPARTHYLAPPESKLPQTEWNNFKIALDKNTTKTREAEVSRLLTALLTAAGTFARTKFA